MEKGLKKPEQAHTPMERKMVKPRFFMAVVSLVLVSIPPGIFFFYAIRSGGDGTFSPGGVLIFSLIYLICAMPGLLAVIRSATSFVALKKNDRAKAEKDSSLVRRCFIVSLIWTLLTVLLMIAAIPSRRSDGMRAFDSIAKSELKRLATAQEEYYLDHDHFAASLKNLVEFRQDGRVTLAITHADQEGWKGTASHVGSATVIFYDSQKGGIQN